MKLPIRCFGCTEERGPRGHIALVEFRDDGRYEAVCPMGHRTVIVLQQSLFEVLFDIGAYAIRDGYYREAVSSFTASLERFHEFFVRAVLLEKKTDHGTIEESWNAIKKQSERQLGAFIFLYASELGGPPPILPQKQVEFRNEVIHRGSIPTRDQSIAYGQTILNLIRPTVSILREKFHSGSQAVVDNYMRNAGGNHIREIGSGVMSIPTILSLADRGQEWDKRALDQAIHELPDWESRVARES